jgi:NACHT domain
MAEALTAALLVGVLKKVAEKTAEGLYGKAKNKLQVWSAKKAIRSAAERILKLGNVKTIWQIEREVAVRDFFVAPTARIGPKKFSIKDYRSVPAQHLVIEGLPGHGKSTVLRQLAITSYVREKIPIFVQALFYEDNTTLADLIRSELQALAMEDLDDQVLAELLQSGLFVLMLDGFDEVKPALELRLIRQVQEFVSRYGEHVPVIVTSRPDTGIQKCPGFDVLRLDRLSAREQRELIEKISASPEDGQELVKALKKGSSVSDDLLITPLMVVILVIVYKAERRVPETLSEFFDNLFLDIAD